MKHRQILLYVFQGRYHNSHNNLSDQSITQNTGHNSKYTKRMPSVITNSNDDEFLDLNAPLMPQIIRKRWTKRYYLEQVHTARYLPRPAVLFPYLILEILTRTPWYVIPIVWFPIITFLAVRAFNEIDTLATITMWITGFFGWTLAEYLFHRSLFHIDVMLPDHQLAFVVHFLLHGFHHFLPMDR